MKNRYSLIKKAPVVALMVFAWLGLTYSPVSAKVPPKAVETLTKTGEALAEIAKEVTPAVVNISTTRIIKVPGGAQLPFNDPFFRQFFGNEFNHMFNVPKEQRQRSLGSGVIVDPNGYIITNNHVVKGADEIKVFLSNKKEFKGKVIGTDPKTDIAVVKIDAKDLPVIPWGNSDKLKVGEIVLAVGNPFGLNQTITMGIVSAVGRANVGIADYEDFIQTDAAINPGNSGGALVNARGELVGINTAIFSTSGGYEGIGFAIPSNMARAVMEGLMRYGKIVRGWLGVSIQDVTPEIAKEFDLKQQKGALVSDVVEGGPAEKAGIKRGDVIIGYDGKDVGDTFQLRNLVAATHPNKEVALKVVRDGALRSINVIIGEMPKEVKAAEGGRFENVLKGIAVQDITPEIANRLNLPSKIKGIVITDIEGGSLAEASGLQRGDIILEIDRKKIINTHEYEAIVSKIKPKDSVLLLIYRRGSTFYLTITP